jgi:hypothetical protein
MKFLLAIILLAAMASLPDAKLTGRWRVKFSLVETPNKNLIFEAKPKGSGTFLLLDTGPDNKPVPDPLPAVWSEIDNGRVSFAANVEMPLGTCCREVGTLIFKGTYAADGSIKGKTIFIASTTDEENFIGFRSSTGTFTATREP